MKRKLLFVIESLVCAGAEKSLVTLLNNIDYSKYEVDLQLFRYGGEFEELLPKEVNVLPPLPYFSFLEEPVKTFLLRRKKHGEIKQFISRIKYSLEIRKKHYSNPEKAVLFWKAAKNYFSVTEKIYDVAIAYAQCVPTFYVVDCVKAKRKLAWVNSIFTPQGKFQKFNNEYYDKIDTIVCVSHDNFKIFNEQFPKASNKTTIIYDINDADFISKMSFMPSNAKEDMNFDGIKILTVGRLATQKGYDIAIEAGKILKSTGINFKWYILGRGPLEADLKELIKLEKLDDNFIFLGTRSNPYPYYKEADIYVQTSKFEGFGLAIAEARMLNIPVVTTNFSAVDAQMINGDNGLVVEMNGESVAKGIMRLLNDKNLYNHIKEYQSKEKKGNVEELEKFYKLVKGEYSDQD